MLGNSAEKTPEALEKLIRKGKAQAVAEFFDGMPEKERRAFAPSILALAPEFFESGWLSEKSFGFKTDESVRAAAAVAAYATASLTEIKKLGWRCRPPFWDAKKQDTYIAVLRDRAPDWIGAWAEWQLEDSFHIWPFVRRMVQAGLCPPPKSDFYVLGMIRGLAPRYGTGGTLADALLAQRDLLDGPFWRLFEVEGGGELSLAACDKYTADDAGWSRALRDLAARGEVDRNRLLDASLDALGRDFAQFRAGWFSRFHEFLEPTVGERARRMQRYLNLLASPIPPTVSFAMKALLALHKAKKLDGAAFLERTEPVFYAKAKGTVKQALRLMTAFAKADAELARAAARMAAAGLEHPETDVQEAAIAFIATFGDPADNDLRAAVQDRIDVAAAPLRPRILDWLGGDAADDTHSTFEPDDDPLDLVARAKALPPDLAAAAGIPALLERLDDPDGTIPSLQFDRPGIPRLSNDAKVAPVGDLDTLIQLFLQALEKPADIELHERVLDGLVRLCGARPDDFDARTGPLAKRMAQLKENRLHGVHHGADPAMLLAALADAWLSGQPLDVTADRKGEPVLRMKTEGSEEKIPVSYFGIAGVFLMRAAAAMQVIAARKSARLLSTPTHRGGWIAPAELVVRSRGAERDDVMDLADRVLALLRLAPDGRETALAAAKNVDGEWGAALRYALGGEESAGETAALWVAAARARAPFTDDPAVEVRFPGLGPGAGQAAKLDYFITSRSEKPYTWHFFNIACMPEPPAKLPLHDASAGAPALMPTVMAHRKTGYVMLCDDDGFHRRDRLTTGYGASPWGATLWPLNPDVLFASTAHDTADCIDDPRAGSAPPYAGYRVAMDPDTSLTRMGHVMLALGLNARDAAEGQTATDLLIAATEDGRLDVQTFGAEMRELLFSGMCKPKRWADRLSDAAGVSPLHAATVRYAVTLALQGAPGVTPRDVHALMELLHALCVEQGEAIADPETRDYLAAITGGGKAAKLAKTLLALKQENPMPHRRAAAARALAGRIERAERWALARS